MIASLFVPLLCLFSLIGPGYHLASGEQAHVEEFFVRNPLELHNVALGVYVKEREKDPANKETGNDTPLMRRARAHAVKRLNAVDDAALNVYSSAIGIDGTPAANKMLQLPTPEGSESFLVTSVTAIGAGAEIMPAEERAAVAASLNEDIGLGAISRAGALPFGEDMAWVKYVEDKMKRDAQIDHQSLLWELGSEVVEQQQIERGGFNISEEQELLANMKDWFIKNGGSLKYVEPSVSQEHGYRLVATEDIAENEVVVQVPIKLTLSRISSRNVLLPRKGKYLGEELKKTFEKNEVWALSVFLLHEWYKETAGKGSKWGPYLRLLRMRSLSTNVLQVCGLIQC